MKSLHRFFPVFTIAFFSFQTLFAQTNCGYVILPAGAVVWIEMLSPLSADNFTVGNNVDFTVYQEVVRNKKTLIARGAPVQGRVKKIILDSVSGRQQVFIGAESVMAVDGQSIELNGTPLQLSLTDSITQLYKMIGRTTHNDRISTAQETTAPKDTTWSQYMAAMPVRKGKTGKRKNTEVPAGTVVLLETTERLNSCQLTAGRTISLRVCADVMVKGRTVVATGATAMGRIASLTKAEAFTSESFTIEMLYVLAVDGTPIQINGLSNDILSEFSGENVVAAPGQKLIARCFNSTVVKARR